MAEGREISDEWREIWWKGFYVWLGRDLGREGAGRQRTRVGGRSAGMEIKTREATKRDRTENKPWAKAGRGVERVGINQHGRGETVTELGPVLSLKEIRKREN